MNPNNSKKIVTVYVSNAKNRKLYFLSINSNDFFPILPEGKKTLLKFKNL